MHTLSESGAAEAAADVQAEPLASDRGRRRRIGLWLSTIWIAAILLGAIFADLLPLADPTKADYDALALSPGFSAHPLGTDQLGRDLLARIVFGARISLAVSVIAIAVATAIGGVLGVIAGYRRGTIERAVLLVSDAALAFPPIVFIMVIVAVVGASFTSVVIGLIIVFLPTYSRLARASTLSIAPREFVSAARSAGASHSRIMWREIAPNVSLPIAAYSVIAMSTAIVAEGTLSFLGLGVPPPTPSWGGMIAAGLKDLERYPHISLVPAAALFITVYALNIIGDEVRSRLDNRMSSI